MVVPAQCLGYTAKKIMD